MDQDRSRYHTILMFGAPGSGKGTQGRILGDLPGFFHLSCGEVFRALDAKSELGQTFIRYSTEGKLVPDEVTVELWSAHIHRLVDTGGFRPEEEVLVLDGIPDQDKLVERMRRRALHENRLDDLNESVIRARFEEYEKETVAVLDHYGHDRIRHVDASRSPIEVLSDVIGVVRFASVEVAV